MQHDVPFEDYLQTLQDEQWDRLWALIPIIEQTEQFGRWEGVETFGVGFQMPYYVAGEVIEHFLEITNQLKLIPVFDWMSWPVGKHIVESADFRPEDHDLMDCCKILTVMIRGNRFNEGLIGNCFEQGLVLKIIKAMKQKVEASK